MSGSDPETWGDWLAVAEQRLAAAGIDEAALEATLLVGHLLGLSRTEVSLARGEPAERPERLEPLLARRCRREPLAYVLGRQEFMGLGIEVGPGVLIPRWDTEPLVERFLAELPAAAEVAEVGCGSGAVAVAVAVLAPHARVYALDSDPAAIACTRQNSVAHGVADRVAPMLGDLAEPLLAAGFAGRLAGLFANLPYIPSERIAGLAPEVRDWEPRTALDGGRDGLELYRRLAPQAMRLVEPGGVIVVECDPEQIESLERIFAATGWLACRDVILDLNGRPRGLAMRRARGA